ncbi:MAG: AgmX/PglI C-terminal domain-containing protein, partial [bacterium]
PLPRGQGGAAVTCRRLDEDLLGDLGEVLDPHIEQCPDCSARVQVYQRVAGWIADGKTLHRPSAEWRNRMFAGVLGDGARLRSIPPAPSGTQPMVSVDAAIDLPAGPPATDAAASPPRIDVLTRPAGTDVPASPPGTDAVAGPPANAVAGSEGVGASSSSRRPQRRWVRAVIPIAGVAVAMAAVVIVRCGGDRQAPRVAIERPNQPSGRGESSGRGEVTRSYPDNAEHTADPNTPERDVQEQTGSGTEAPALPGKQPASTRHPGGSSEPGRPAVPSSTRGGEVVVDWGPDGSGSSVDAAGAVHIAFDPPTGDFGGLTADEIQRVIEGRIALYRACYVTELARAPTLRGKLVVHLQIGGDGRVQAADSPASRESTLRNESVAQCVIDHMKRLVFPAKGQMASVTSSFDLRSR